VLDWSSATGRRTHAATPLLASCQAGCSFGGSAAAAAAQKKEGIADRWRDNDVNAAS
jgi:hypothetical protein